MPERPNTAQTGQHRGRAAAGHHRMLRFDVRLGYVRRFEQRPKRLQRGFAAALTRAALSTAAAFCQRTNLHRAKARRPKASAARSSRSGTNGSFVVSCITRHRSSFVAFVLNINSTFPGGLALLGPWMVTWRQLLRQWSHHSARHPLQKLYLRRSRPFLLRRFFVPFSLGELEFHRLIKRQSAEYVIPDLRSVKIDI